MKSKNPHSGCRAVEVSKTLDASDPNPCKNQGGMAIVAALPFDTTQVTSPQNGNNPKWGDPCHPLAAQGHPPAVICKGMHLFENHSQDTRYRGPLEVSPMLPAQLGTGGNNTPFVVEEDRPVYCLQGSMLGRADKNGPQGDGVNEGGSFTLNTTDRHAVAYPLDAIQYIVRRLTPTECARLQGFADRWGEIDEKDSLTAEEYQFWLEVRNTHAAINGKAVKEYTVEQMLKWYNKLHTDSAEYKMWGNGIALPPAIYCMQCIAYALEGVSDDWML